MNQGKACYRKLRKYEYQLMNDYVTKIGLKPVQDIEFAYLSLSSTGILKMKKTYAWDGPSGPTIDTKDFMRGSLVHDALYQLMRLQSLDYKKYRKQADVILREICIEDGMSKFRAWYVYQAVRIFAGGAARPRKEPEVKIICVP